MEVHGSFFEIFQLTPSRRATYIYFFFPSLQHYFNSRPHGGRHPQRRDFTRVFVFQLTPSRRATLSNPFPQITESISTHALTEGDYEMFGQRSIEIISTHALTEGDADC